MPEERIIEFSASGDYPPPVPAVRNMPEWLKRIAGDMAAPANPQEALTVKRCPPFVEAVGFGYLIPAPFTMRFDVDLNGALSVVGSASADAAGLHVAAMPPSASARAPFAGHLVLLFPNPWIIRTAPGYSTLLTAPLNRSDFPFRILSQLIDTDTHPQIVTIPAISFMQPGQQFQLDAGTPLIQAIPIRREEWQLTICSDDQAHAGAQEHLLRSTAHYYKAEHWQKKGYA